MTVSTNAKLRRQRRKRHVRKKVSGTPLRPRLTVFRSHRNIYAQIIDDTAGETLAAASSMEGPIRQQLGDGGGGSRQAAKVVGAALGAKAAGVGVKKAVFDRNGYAYHGRLRDLADAVRESGLDF